ncbi:MAG: hypothetical protein CMN27_09650 [Salinisphaera sp.]|nr:hypothetical protein [Salinisphaera sp.]
MNTMSDVEPGECGMEKEGSPDSPRVRLFVAGDAPSSRRARRAIEELLGVHDSVDKSRFEIVDVLREPERALESRLLATPTLIIEKGETVSRYVGDLYGREDILEELSHLARSA